MTVVSIARKNKENTIIKTTANRNQALRLTAVKPMVAEREASKQREGNRRRAGAI